MDYIRWLIEKHIKPDPQILIPVVALVLALTVCGFMIHPFVGSILLTLSLAVFGTIAYAAISDAYRKSYKKYQEEKSKP